MSHHTMNLLTIRQDPKRIDRLRPQLQRRSFIPELLRLEIHGMATPSSEKLVLFVVLAALQYVLFGER